MHRIRLSDEEIKMLARALKWFCDFIDEKGLLELRDRLRYRDLYIRFGDWGSEGVDSERPMYRRTHRGKRFY